MDYFTITDYDFEVPREFKADTIVLSDRHIYASDYESQDNIEMRIDGAVLSIIIDNEYNVRSSNWTCSYFCGMDEETKDDLKDFTKL